MRNDDVNDWRLLRQYVNENSEAAFSELVRRYINLVYATSRREVGDPTLAEDVTQVVFLTMARRAPAFLPNIELSKWLFAAARFTARDVLKQERRRRFREAKAVAFVESVPVDVDGPLELAVNAALDGLSPEDWRAVHLRFYEDLSLAEVGKAIGVSEDTAQKRVSRALQRMRKSMMSSGVALGAVAVEEVIRAESARAASETLAQSVLGNGSIPTAGAVDATHIHQLAKGVLKTMFMKQIAVATAIVAVGVSGAVVAPVVGNALRGPASNVSRGSRSVNSGKVNLDNRKEQMDNRKAYLNAVHVYNQRWVAVYDHLATYTDKNIKYESVKVTPHGVRLRAYAPSIAAVNLYLKKIYNDPDFSTVSINALPGYPEPTIKKYYLNGKLIGLGGKPAPYPVPSTHLSNLTIVKPGKEHVYSVQEALAKQLTPIHSNKRRQRIVAYALSHQVTVRTRPKGFWMTVNAQFQHPISDPLVGSLAK